MKNALLIFFSALFLLPACGGDHHEGEEAVVRLNNGERWEANPETTTGIALMQDLLGKYDGRTDAADRQAMKEELETVFQDIFRQCTMKGEAHDQLHNYLLPMKDLFEKIGSSEVKESQAAVRALEAHLSEYSTYFQ